MMQSILFLGLTTFLRLCQHCAKLLMGQNGHVMIFTVLLYAL